MQDEMNRVFSQAGSGGLSRRDDIAWVPAIEVAEKDGNLIVSAELPGLTDREIRRTERRYGAFYRAIQLPEGPRLTRQARNSGMECCA